MNLEQVNKIRAEKGLDPLTELPQAQQQNNEGGAGKTEEELEQERQQQQQQQPPESKEINLELNDELVLNYLNSKGKAFTSLDEVLTPKTDPTEEEVRADKEKRESRKLAFGLESGKVNKKQLEEFISDTANPNEVVFAQYYAEQKEEDDSLTDEEIRAEFEDKYQLNAENTSRGYKRGQKEITLLAESILRKKHKNIYELENEYSDLETSETNRVATERKIASGLPAYTELVNGAINNLSTIKTKFSGGESYELPQEGEGREKIEQALAKIKQNFLAPEFAHKQILRGYSKEEIEKMAWLKLLSDEWPLLAEAVANQHLLKHQAGVRGITPRRNEAGNDRSTQTFKLTPEQEKMRELHQQHTPAEAQQN